MSKSLKELMTINRFVYYRMNPIDCHVIDPIIIIPIPIIPIIPPIINYILSDFGENAINNHNLYDSWHSEKNQTIFNYVTKNFRNRCTSIQTYNTNSIGNNMISSDRVLEVSKLVKADIIFTPYVNAAYWGNGNYYGFVLSIASHYDNNGQFLEGIEGNRHDITISPDIFLTESVAVSARIDTPSTFKNSTSFGYGMEFFEDMSANALNVEYPDKDVPSALAQVTTDISGTIMTTQHNPNFPANIRIGERITVYNTAISAHEDTYIQEILSNVSVKVSPAVTPITVDYIYIWNYVTLSEFCGGEQESWAVPLVAAKLKVIKLTTNTNWATVRNAARLTAKRNPTGIPEIDNTNWDMYRGFGCININAAINYINSL